jgi:uncharacterized protein (DUF1501 family)
MNNSTRREFLRRSAALGLLRGAAPFGLSLAGIGAAAAASDPKDYRAIVCLFMRGANDCHNTVIPYDKAGYDGYVGARRDISIAHDTLQPLKVANTPGREFALHPALGAMHGLFDKGNAAIIANVGPLVVPINCFRITTRKRSCWRSRPKEPSSAGVARCAICCRA